MPESLSMCENGQKDTSVIRRKGEGLKQVIAGNLFVKKLANPCTLLHLHQWREYRPEYPEKIIGTIGRKNK